MLVRLANLFVHNINERYDSIILYHNQFTWFKINRLVILVLNKMTFTHKYH